MFLIILNAEIKHVKWSNIESCLIPWLTHLLPPIAPTPTPVVQWLNEETKSQESCVFMPPFQSSYNSQEGPILTKAESVSVWKEKKVHQEDDPLDCSRFFTLISELYQGSLLALSVLVSLETQSRLGKILRQHQHFASNLNTFLFTFRSLKHHCFPEQSVKHKFISMLPT